MKSAPSDMASSTADVQHDFLQIVDGVIGASLIDNVVKSLADESAAQAIYTEFKWTTACEDLLRTYREQIHPNVYRASSDKCDGADIVYRSSVDRRLLPLSSPIRRRNERSK